MSEARSEGTRDASPDAATDDELAPAATAFAPHPACGIPLSPDWITLGPSASRPDPRPGMRASTEEGIGGRLKAVSYTHLTLPTKA